MKIIVVYNMADKTYESFWDRDMHGEDIQGQIRDEAIENGQIVDVFHVQDEHYESARDEKLRPPEFWGGK